MIAHAVALAIDLNDRGVVRGPRQKRPPAARSASPTARLREPPALHAQGWGISMIGSEDVFTIAASGEWLWLVESWFARWIAGPIWVLVLLDGCVVGDLSLPMYGYR